MKITHAKNSHMPLLDIFNMLLLLYYLSFILSLNHLSEVARIYNSPLAINTTMCFHIKICF